MCSPDNYSIETAADHKRQSSFTKIFIVITVIAFASGGLLGYLVGFAVFPSQIETLQDQVLTLQDQVMDLQTQAFPNVTYLVDDNVSLSQLYESVKNGVVVIHGILVQYDRFGRAYYGEVQGSGFVYNLTGEIVIITNYHVVYEASDLTVTFANGNGYAATILGTDPYADLAILSTDAPLSEYIPLTLVSSSTLAVGDPVIAVGNPYGLAGSMSTGIIGALGRTITEEMTGNYPIPNVVQTTTPLNPGNSGGPLLNYQGYVIGITTAIIEGSQGVGFAIPSNTIIREIRSLVDEGMYDGHPWLGATGIDMTYEIAKAMEIDTTYGWLIDDVISQGPAGNAGLQGGTEQVQIAGTWVTIGGDIIIAIDDIRITGIDDLSTYLEEYTVPGDRITVTLVRDNQLMTLTLEVGDRPE